MHIGRARSDTPILITGAPVSLDDQHDARRRKYLIMMGLRVVCVLAAVSVASFSLLLSLVFVVGGVVLPWCAVLIANDRPPKRASTFAGYTKASSQSQITAGQGKDDANRP